MVENCKILHILIESEAENNATFLRHGEVDPFLVHDDLRWSLIRLNLI